MPLLVREKKLQPTTFVRPACQKCGNAMKLARIEPLAPGIDQRTFECNACGDTETILVKFN